VLPDRLFGQDIGWSVQCSPKQQPQHCCLACLVQLLHHSWSLFQDGQATIDSNLQLHVVWGYLLCVHLTRSPIRAATNSQLLAARAALLR